MKAGFKNELKLSHIMREVPWDIDTKEYLETFGIPWAKNHKGFKEYFIYIIDDIPWNFIASKNWCLIPSVNNFPFFLDENYIWDLFHEGFKPKFMVYIKNQDLKNIIISQLGVEVQEFSEYSELNTITLYNLTLVNFVDGKIEYISFS